MAGECYEKVLASHKPKKDWQMPSVTIFGVALLCTLGFLIFAVCRTQYIYNRFKADWVKTIVYAQRRGTFSVRDGETSFLFKGSLDEAYSALFWRGRPIDVPEETPGLEITYGDGSISRFWNTVFADYSKGQVAENKPGVILAYTNPAGKTYCVEAEDDYDLLRAWLLGQVKNYYSPTREELAWVEESRSDST